MAILFNDFIDDYDCFVFDFDGVIADTNSLKKDNIKKSVTNILPYEILDEFVNYFITNNGIPREEKISKFVSDKLNFDCVMKNYSELNNKSFSNVLLIDGIITFLQELYNRNKTLVILSGGVSQEITKILKEHELQHLFSKILTGPINKYRNFCDNIFTAKGNVLYFGDSFHDYDLANLLNIEFVFVSGKSQNYDWRKQIDVKNVKYIINNFLDVNYGSSDDN